MRFQLARHLEGGKFAERFDGGDDLVVDDRRLHETVPAVDDPVPEGIDPLRVREPDAVQPLEHVASGLSVVSHWGGLLENLSPFGAELDGRWAADAFDDPVGQPTLTFRLDELESER